MKTIFKTVSLGILFINIYSCTRENNDISEYSDYVVKNKDEKIDTLSRASLGPNDDPRQDGAFIIDALNGKVYVKFEGKLRHILALPTFEGVFKRNEIHLFTMRQENMLYNTSSTGFGDTMGPNTELIKHIATGQIYLAQGNTIRYIPDMNIANRYRFNLNYVRDVSSISNYVLLTPITITF